MSTEIVSLLVSAATSASVASLLFDALKRLKRFKDETTIKGLVANQLRKSCDELIWTVGKQDYLNQLYERADQVTESLVQKIRKTKPRNSSELAHVLEKAISEQGIAIPTEAAGELSRLTSNDLGAILASGGWLLRYEGRKKLKVARNAREVREIRAYVTSIPSKPRKHSVDTIPGKFTARVFVGGPYDDLPTLREIGKHVKRGGYVPIIPYYFELPRANNDPLLDIHDMDILLLHNCRAAIFELSLPAGQYNEVEWSIRQFRKKTLGLCKARESGQLPRELISTMVIDLFRQSNQPLEPYADFVELEHSVTNFLRNLGA